MIGIYKITNTVNNKCYIGKSESCIEDRLDQHRKGLNSNKHLQRSIKKYGIDKFTFEILEECSQEDCCDRERYWIKKLNSIFPNGYNYTSGGENKSGFTFCEESRLKMSKSAKRFSETARGKELHSMGGKSRKWTEEERLKVSNTLKERFVDKTKVPMYGKKHTEETKKRMSESRKGENHPMYGKHFTDEHRQRLSESHKGQFVSEESRRKQSEARTGRRWINNSKENKFIKPEDLCEFLELGWTLGKIK